MYKQKSRLGIGIILLSIFILLTAMSPLADTPAQSQGIFVACGDKVSVDAIVDNIQGPDLSNPKCVPTDKAFLTFSTPDTEGTLNIDQYYSGLQGILTFATTNRSFSIGSTGFQEFRLRATPEDSECIFGDTIWSRISGVTTPYATFYDNCSGVYLYSAVLNSTWATDYERTISGTSLPAYAEALVETSSGCYRGTLYNYTAGAWQWKGSAVCNIGSSAYYGSLVFGALASNSSTYTQYSTPEFDLLNTVTINPSTGQWSNVPSTALSTVMSTPWFNDPYRISWGTTSNGTYTSMPYIIGELHH
jgi:hypothetical protein